MKFNLLTKKTSQVVNHEGAKAFRSTPELDLYAAVATAGLSDTFYEKQDNRLLRITSLIQKCSPEFVAKLAVYVRTQMHMRSVPLFMTVELAKRQSGNALVATTVKNVVCRADEIAELLACYQLMNERSDSKKLNRLSKQIQKGLAMSFNEFDEYQFAKYNRATSVKLKDALFLVHPKAKDESQQAIFDKIAKDELATPYTWETELSAVGQQKFEDMNDKSLAFTKTWEELIDSKKIGYMALMRNLRNIIGANVSRAHIEKVCAYLSNETAIANSKQLPFRFLAAYREIKALDSRYVSLVLEALEDAVMLSARNVKGFDSDTSVVIACDVSGSMQKAVSARSKIQLYDIGLMLAMLMQSQCRNAVTGMFGDTWKVINMSRRNVLANVQEFYSREGEVGYSTNGYLVIEDLIKRRLVVDKVMLFTDTQMWSSHVFGGSFSSVWSRYKKIAPKAKLYMFDLAGYGKLPIDIIKDDVHLIAGWSDKIFDVLHAIDNGSSALEKINAIELIK